MSKSFLEPEGLYNPTLRFAFTNITNEDFTSKWDGVPVIVKPHETIEVSNTTPIPGAGHALAIKMTGEMVDKIILDEAKADEMAHPDLPYYRSPKASALGVPAARKVWEDQILRELTPDEESPALQTIRKQMRDEIISGGEQKKNTEPPPVPTSAAEFADLTKPSVPKPEAKPAKVKHVKE